jgi:hypothetical protein
MTINLPAVWVSPDVGRATGAEPLHRGHSAASDWGDRR